MKLEHSILTWTVAGSLLVVVVASFKRWIWVAVPALVLLLVSMNTWWTFQMVYKEDPEQLCKELAPGRGLDYGMNFKVEPDWRWFPPSWWCTYRWEDGVVTTRSLEGRG